MQVENCSNKKFIWRKRINMLYPLLVNFLHFQMPVMQSLPQFMDGFLHVRYFIDLIPRQCKILSI